MSLARGYFFERLFDGEMLLPRKNIWQILDGQSSGTNLDQRRPSLSAIRQNRMYDQITAWDLVSYSQERLNYFNG
jgi:hypothetical protein